MDVSVTFSGFSFEGFTDGENQIVTDSEELLSRHAYGFDQDVSMSQDSISVDVSLTSEITTEVSLDE